MGPETSLYPVEGGKHGRATPVMTSHKVVTAVMLGVSPGAGFDECVALLGRATWKERRAPPADRQGPLVLQLQETCELRVGLPSGCRRSSNTVVTLSAPKS